MNTIITILNITINQLTKMRDKLVDRSVNKFIKDMHESNKCLEMRGME